MKVRLADISVIFNNRRYTKKTESASYSKSHVAMGPLAKLEKIFVGSLH